MCHIQSNASCPQRRFQLSPYRKKRLPHKCHIGYLIAQRAVRRAGLECSIDFSKNESPKDESKSEKRTSIPKTVPKRHPRTENWPPEGRKWHQERPKMVIRGAEDGPKSDPKPQDEKRTEPRRSQDRLGPPKCRFAHYPCAPGRPFGTPKRLKIEAKIQDEKKAIQDDLGPVLERSWVDLGPILGSILSKNHWKT